MNLPYQIIASDLDKTLLNDACQVSPENWAAIEKLHRLGVHFVPASGRSFEEMPIELRECPFIRYYLSSNGSVIYDKVTGDSYERAFSRELGQAVLDKLYSYPVCLMLHAENRSYVDIRTHNAAHYQSFHMNQIWVDFALSYDKPVSDLKAYAYQLPSIQSFCVFFLNMEDLLECKAFLEQDERLLVAQTDPCNLEIFTSQAGKGNGLHLLAEQLSIPIKQTIAVGDSTNDMTMVQAAGLGLAMENAVPELKAAADAVICTNEEHSIQYILKHYIEP